MQNGIINLSLVAVRKSDSDKSEMISQLLFGESFDILDYRKEWMLIKTHHDSYTGWIDYKQFLKIEAEQLLQFNESKKYYALDLVNKINFHDRSFSICIGSSLPSYNGNFGVINGHKYTYEGRVICQTDVESQKYIAKIALLFLNVPYFWGGRSPFGIDCSGFSQIVFKLNGLMLKRDSFQQAEQGVEVNNYYSSKQGDLAFFEDEEAIISHVGILLGNNQIIHSCGRVKIDKIDDKGIIDNDSQKHTHKLRCIKSFF